MQKWPEVVVYSKGVAVGFKTKKPMMPRVNYLAISLSLLFDVSPNKSAVLVSPVATCIPSAYPRLPTLSAAGVKGQVDSRATRHIWIASCLNLLRIRLLYAVSSYFEIGFYTYCNSVTLPCSMTIQ